MISLEIIISKKKRGSVPHFLASRKEKKWQLEKWKSSPTIQKDEFGLNLKV